MQGPPSNDPDHAGPSITGKKKKRIVTPARREQNREAQRKWRERRKARSEGNQVQTGALDTNTSEGIRSSPAEQDRRPAREENGSVSVEIDDRVVPADRPGTTVSLFSTPLGSTAIEPSDVEEVVRREEPPLSNSRPLHLQSVTTRAAGYHVPGKNWMTCLAKRTKASLKLDLSDPIFARPVPVPISKEFPSSHLCSRVTTEQITSSIVLQDPATLCNPNVDLVPSQSSLQSFIPLSQLQMHSVAELLNHHLPSPYVNHIRVSRYSLYTACLSNSRHMHVPDSLALSPSFTSPFYEKYIDFDTAVTLTTPFVSPYTTITYGTGALFGYPTTHNTTEDGYFTYLPKALRPVPHQISIEHDFWIDVLPFPGLRRKIIELVHTMPKGVDDDELKRDLDDDGLVCWGGAPWDPKNWEASLWFLGKWWWLDVAGELSRGSERWRALRGDQAEDVDDLLFR